MTGLTDSQQGELMLVSGILIAVGAASVPAGAPWYVGLGLGFAGAVGLYIKEKLGSAPPPTSEYGAKAS